MHTEADRKAFNEARIANEHAAEVAVWLAANPEIGALNNGTYYKIENGEAINVAELS